jgi:hypothetical protein
LNTKETQTKNIHLLIGGSRAPELLEKRHKKELLLDRDAMASVAEIDALPLSKKKKKDKYFSLLEHKIFTEELTDEQHVRDFVAEVPVCTYDQMISFGDRKLEKERSLETTSYPGDGVMCGYDMVAGEFVPAGWE